jgi:hypothetical protein
MTKNRKIYLELDLPYPVKSFQVSLRFTMPFDDQESWSEVAKEEEIVHAWRIGG